MAQTILEFVEPGRESLPCSGLAECPDGLTELRGALLRDLEQRHAQSA